jgi:hypothetical protein
MKNIAKQTNGKITRTDLLTNLEKKIGADKIMNSIKSLCDLGYVFEEDDHYTIF